MVSLEGDRSAYLDPFLKGDHEGQLCQDGELPLLGHGQRRGLHAHYDMRESCVSHACWPRGARKAAGQAELEKNRPAGPGRAGAGPRGAARGRALGGVPKPLHAVRARPVTRGGRLPRRAAPRSQSRAGWAARPGTHRPGWTAGGLSCPCAGTATRVWRPARTAASPAGPASLAQCVPARQLTCAPHLVSWAALTAGPFQATLRRPPLSWCAPGVRPPHLGSRPRSLPAQGASTCSI